jgi:peptidyl-prolyl cis-trans isomerase B (cyclophilin B)
MPVRRFILMGCLLTALTLTACTSTTTNNSTAANSSPGASLAPATASYETSTEQKGTKPAATTDSKAAAKPAESVDSRAVAKPAESADSKSGAKPYADLPRLQGKATVVMVIGGKSVTMELDGDRAPITAGNFEDLIKKGFYNGLNFHRVEKGFVVQGGDPNGNGTGGYKPKGKTTERRIPLEIKIKGSPAPTYSQVFEDSKIIDQPPELTHKRGALAMARSADPDSASSQFYVTLADAGFLDGKYAVFGKVTKGMEVIDGIKVGDKITSIKITSKTPTATKK